MKSALPVVLLLVLASFASGCLGEFAAEPDAGADEGPSRQGAGAPVAPARSGPSPEPEPEAVSTARRWHFHNYWGESPNLTLFEGWVGFELAADSGRFVAGFRPEAGLIVPPESGRIDVKVVWNETAVPVALNLSYRPSSAAEYLPHGPVANGVNASIAVAENMTDVPHAAETGWAFRLGVESSAAAAVPGTAPEAAHVTVVASIGRPIFIDPPHEDRWNGTRTLRIAGWEGVVDTTVRAGDTAGRIEGGGVEAGSPVVAHVVPSAQVPEGARSVLARLSWESEAPGATGSLVLRFTEAGTGVTGMPEPTSAAEGVREYRIPLEPAMADNPYSNQTAWSFDVLLEGDLAVFQGTVRLDVWTSKDSSHLAVLPEPAP